MNRPARREGKPAVRRGRKARGLAPQRRPGHTAANSNSPPRGRFPGASNDHLPPPACPDRASSRLLALVAAGAGARCLAEAATHIAATGRVAEIAAASPGPLGRGHRAPGRGRTQAEGRAAVGRHRGRVTGDLHIFNGLAARLRAARRRAPAARPGRRGRVAERRRQARRRSARRTCARRTRSPATRRRRGTTAPAAESATGLGVGVAVIDTGIAGAMPDFRVSTSDPSSRVIGSAVVNPLATTAEDTLRPRHARRRHPRRQREHPRRTTIRCAGSTSGSPRRRTSSRSRSPTTTATRPSWT